MHDRIQIGVIKAVKIMNSIDTPSIPNLNLMKPLTQFFSSLQIEN